LKVQARDISDNQERISIFNPRQMSPEFAAELEDQMVSRGVGLDGATTFVIKTSTANIKAITEKINRTTGISKDNCGGLDVTRLFGATTAKGRLVLAALGRLLPSIGQHRAVASKSVQARMDACELDPNPTLTTFPNAKVIIMSTQSSEQRTQQIVRAIRFIGQMDNTVKGFRKVVTWADTTVGMIDTCKGLCGAHRDWPSFKAAAPAMFKKAATAWKLEKDRVVAATPFTKNTVGAIATLCVKPVAIVDALRTLMTMTTTSDGENFTAPTSGGGFILLGHAVLSEAAILGVLNRVIAGTTAPSNIKKALRMCIVIELALRVADAEVEGFERIDLDSSNWAGGFLMDPFFSGVVRAMNQNLSIKTQADIPATIAASIKTAFANMKSRHASKLLNKEFKNVSVLVCLCSLSFVL
jgi:hypothetical protein